MKDGRLHPALPGLGYLVSRTRVPVVPVYLSGTDRIRRCMMRRERVRITFGAALPATLWPPAAEDSTRSGRDRHRSIGDRVMQEIAELIAERGPFMPDEILPELSAVTLRGATLHKEPLSPGAPQEEDGRAGVVRTLLRASRRGTLRPSGRMRCADAQPGSQAPRVGRRWTLGTKPYWQ